MRDVKRRQIQSTILKWMYDRLLESTSMWALPEQGDIEDFEWTDVQYELRRLDGDGFIEGQHLKRITARGIEYLQDLGVETLLDGDLRERVLATLYEADRQRGPYAGVKGGRVAEVLSEPESAVAVVLHYLAKLRLKPTRVSWRVEPVWA